MFAKMSVYQGEENVIGPALTQEFLHKVKGIKPEGIRHQMNTFVERGLYTDALTSTANAKLSDPRNAETE